MKPGDATDRGRVARRPTRSSRGAWWAEVLLVAALYVGYEVQRGLATVDTAAAVAHGRDVLGLERAVGLAPESVANHWLAGVPVLAVAAAYFYAVLHYLITPVVLVWLWRRRPDRYGPARTVLAIATGLGLVGFWLLPTAPPRLLPGSPVRDTLSDVRGWGWWGGEGSAPRGLGGLTDQFAAMPSLHVGWALWAGLAVALWAERNWVRCLGAVYPVLTTAVVVATGNHYLVDAVAGAAVVGAAVVVLRAAGRVRHLGTWAAPRVRALVTTWGTRRRLLVLAGIVLAIEAIVVGPVVVDALADATVARPGWVPVAVVAEALSIVGLAGAQRTLLRGVGVTPRLPQVVRTAFEANALYVSVPGGSVAAVAYSVRRMRRWGADASRAAFVVAASGVLGTVALAGLALGGALLGDGSSLAGTVVVSGSIALAAAIGFAVFLVVVSRSARRGSLRPDPGHRLRDLAHSSIATLATARPSARTWIRALALAVVHRGGDLACLLVACFAIGAGPAVTPTVLVAYAAGTAAASAVPLLPAGLGPVDAALVMTLTGGGVSGADATAAVLLYRIVSLGGLAATGWLLLLTGRRSTAVRAIPAHRGRCTARRTTRARRHRVPQASAPALTGPPGRGPPSGTARSVAGRSRGPSGW